MFRHRGSSSARSATPLVVVLLLVGLFCLGVGLGTVTDLPLPHWGGGSDTPRGASAPTHIKIPAIQLNARVLGVGTAPDGSIDTPSDFEATGWYERGPSPGANGTAVIVGHVDSESAPAVFHRLADLRPGTRIEVNRRDRRVAVFLVDSIERYDKSHFPGARILTASARPRLALVTCGGRWVGGATGYADNVIVFATLATPSI